MLYALVLTRACAMSGSTLEQSGMVRATGLRARPRAFQAGSACTCRQAQFEAARVLGKAGKRMCATAPDQSSVWGLTSRHSKPMQCSPRLRRQGHGVSAWSSSLP